MWMEGACEPLGIYSAPHPDSCLALYQVTPIGAIDQPPLNRSECVCGGVCRRGLRRRVPPRERRCWTAHRRQRAIRRARARRHTPLEETVAAACRVYTTTFTMGRRTFCLVLAERLLLWAPDEAATCRRRGRYGHV